MQNTKPLIHICHRHNNIFFMNSYVWVLKCPSEFDQSVETKGLNLIRVHKHHLPLTLTSHLLINVFSGFPPLSSKTSHTFSILQSLVFCTLHHLFQIYYHSVSYLCTVCKKQGTQRWKDSYQRLTWCWNHLI